LEVVTMIDQLPRVTPEVRADRPDRAFRWSWYLFLLSWPWHLIGGGLAWWVTSLAGGAFSAGEGVPGWVYPALYAWMLVPLVASVVVGGVAWLRDGRPWAIVPAFLSATLIATISIFGASEWFGT
jgi:hypothetical protein